MCVCMCMPVHTNICIYIYEYIVYKRTLAHVRMHARTAHTCTYIYACWPKNAEGSAIRISIERKQGRGGPPQNQL